MSVQRQGNYELLRIISMVVIIAGHFAGYGTVFDSNFYLKALFMLGAHIGNVCFVMISAWFLTEKGKQFRAVSVMKIVFAAWIYSILLTIFKIALTEATSGGYIIKSLYNMIFPIINGKWWFISSYVAMYLMFPFLNKILEWDNKKAKLLIVAIFGFGTYIGTFLPFATHYFNSVLWIVFVYLFTGLIKSADFSFLRNRSVLLTLFLVTVSIMYISFLIIKNLQTKFNIGSENTFYYFGMDYSILPLIAGGSLFLLFAKLDINNYKIIRFFAGSTLGVYLLHEDAYARVILWQTLFSECFFPPLLLYGILVVFVVFVLFSSIDFFMRNTLERFVFSYRVVKNAAQKIDNFYKSLNL